VAEFAAPPSGAAEERSRQDDPRTDPDLSRDVHEVGGQLGSGGLQFAEGGEVGLVVDRDTDRPQPSQVRQRAPDVDVAPLQVGRHEQPSLLHVDESGHADADTGDGQTQAFRLPPGGGDHPGRGDQDLLGITPPLVLPQDRPMPHLAGQVQQAGGHIVDVDLHAQPGDGVSRDDQAGGGPPGVLRLPGLDLGDQPSGDHGVHQRGDRRPRQPCDRGDVGPGDGVRRLRDHAQHQGEIASPQTPLVGGPTVRSRGSSVRCVRCGHLTPPWHLV
jgi:hypothetical protein